MTVHGGAGLCVTLRGAAQNQTAGIAEVSQPLPHQNAKGKPDMVQSRGKKVKKSTPKVHKS